MSIFLKRTSIVIMKLKHRSKRAAVFVVLLLISLAARSQSDNWWHYSLENQTTISGAGKLPFWFRSGQYGSIPLSGISTGLIGNIYKGYDSTNNNAVDWAVGLQVRANAGNTTNFSIIEGYAKVRASIFELSLGRTKDVVGLVDTSLSSGSFAVSGNSLGIPKISLAIPEYFTLPIFDKLFAIKGNYAFGYFGSVGLQQQHAKVLRSNQYYQQTTFYARLGKPEWRLKLMSGINHNVMFGNERQIFGSEYTLSSLQTLIYSAIGKTYHHPDPFFDEYLGGKVGNHIGSVDFGLQYDFDRFRVEAYHQVIYDVGAIGHLANLNDGITGVSIINTYQENDRFNWKRILFELVHTKDQAGALTSKSPSGDEDYYNDGEFLDGWSYYYANIGNPLLTSQAYTRDGLPVNPVDYFINNRVIGFHTAAQASLDDMLFTLKLTLTRNYGTYGTSFEGHTTGPRRYIPEWGFFNQVNQFSGYIDVNKTFYNGLSGGVAVGYDYGGLYYNTLGVQLRLKKTFN